VAKSVTRPGRSERFPPGSGLVIGTGLGLIAGFIFWLVLNALR